LFNALCQYANIADPDDEGAQAKFIANCAQYLPLRKSQRFQDVLADFVMQGKPGIFCEFGATDGVSLSNTFFLETYRGWSGILAEPGMQWRDALVRNRPNATIDHRCVFSESGQTLLFNETTEGEYSSIVGHEAKDFHSPKRQKGSVYEVQTVSLNDLLSENSIEKIDFLSIDTEGSEFIILSNFDFEEYCPKIIAVEHNYTVTRQDIFNLLTKRDYVRVMEDLSGFDDWYISRSQSTIFDF
jgi:FkbM family methyltransferase